MRRVYPVYTCKICGSEFTQTYNLNHHKQEFCSRHCARSQPRGSFGTVTLNGYIAIFVDGKRMYQHRYVMEQHLGRKLLRSEVVHHMDGNKQNNDISNLELVENCAVHMTMHARAFRSKTHKECTTCREVKPRSEYSPRKVKPGSLVDPNKGECKKCAAAKNYMRTYGHPKPNSRG